MRSLGVGLECWDGLAFDATLFHFRLELLHVADSRKEMRLAVLITVKGSKPSIPFPFRCFGLLEITNDRKLFAREETVVDDGIVLPAITSTGHVIVGFYFQAF